MVRGKIQIKKLETAQKRGSTYNKRYKGLEKKAKELSVLSGVPVLLVVGTPKGSYRVCVGGGDNSTFSEIVNRYCSEDPQTHNAAKEKTIKLLRAACKDDLVMNVRSQTQNRMHSNEDEEDSEEKKRHEKIIQEIAEFDALYRDIDAVEKIESFDHLLAMENTLKDLITRNKKIEELLLEQQTISYVRDPRCSTSTAAASVVPTAPSTSNYSAFPHRRDPRCSTSTAAASVVPTAPSTSNYSAFPYRRDPRCSTSTAAAPVVPTAPFMSNYMAFPYQRDLLKQMELLDAQAAHGAHVVEEHNLAAPRGLPDNNLNLLEGNNTAQASALPRINMPEGPSTAQASSLPAINMSEGNSTALTLGLPGAEIDMSEEHNTALTLGRPGANIDMQEGHSTALTLSLPGTDIDVPEGDSTSLSLAFSGMNMQEGQVRLWHWL